MPRLLGRAPPARAGGRRRLADVDGPRRRSLGAPRPAEAARRAGARAARLVLGGRQLALDLGIRALQGGGLETQPQPCRAGCAAGERRSPRTPAVPSGAPLRRPVISLKAVATSRCSADPSASARASRSPPRDPSGGAGEVAQRLGERAGQEPGHGEAEQQGHHADPDQRDHVVAHLPLHGVDSLSHAHRAGSAGPPRPPGPR